MSASSDNSSTGGGIWIPAGIVALVLVGLAAAAGISAMRGPRRPGRR